MEELKEYQKHYLEPRQTASYDSEKPTVYLIEGCSGSYDMFHTFAVSIKKNLDDAVKFVTEHELWKNKVERLSIGNTFDEEDYLREDENNEYYDLHNAFYEYAWKTVAPDAENEDELTTDKYIKIYELTSDDDEFVKFLVSKGYSQEVAEATVAFHEGETSEYNTTYSIYKINIE